MSSKVFYRVSLVLILVLFVLLQSSQAYKAESPYDIARPYLFSVTRWEAQNIFTKWAFRIAQLYRGGYAQAGDLALVDNYFRLGQEIDRLASEVQRAGALAERAGELPQLEAGLARLRQEREGLEGQVEAIIEGQLGLVLADEGLHQRLGWVQFVFPPVDFEPEPLPHLLILSPRHEIKLQQTILLDPFLTLEEMEAIEVRAERLGVSALVERVGGLATYPALVPETTPLPSALTTIAHEWLHGYFFFQPLGRNYRASYEMTTINETAADIAGQELGSMVYRLYGKEVEQEAEGGVGRGEEPGFDFNREMRQTRLAVDDFLDRGRVEEAERFMEEKRLSLASQGYFIRRLNQAYFAFHGSYADAPTSVSPIGAQLKALRIRSASVGEFVRSVASISSYEELEMRLGEQP